MLVYQRVSTRTMFVRSTLLFLSLRVWSSVSLGHDQDVWPRIISAKSRYDQEVCIWLSNILLFCGRILGQEHWNPGNVPIGSEETEILRCLAVWCSLDNWREAVAVWFKTFGPNKTRIGICQTFHHLSFVPFFLGSCDSWSHSALFYHQKHPVFFFTTS